jgi:hypothetical protein
MEFNANDLPRDLLGGYPLEHMFGPDWDNAVFRSGGQWYYQFGGCNKCWGPYDSAEAALVAAQG